jgi:hypothetical protein
LTPPHRSHLSDYKDFFYIFLQKFKKQQKYSKFNILWIIWWSQGDTPKTGFKAGLNSGNITILPIRLPGIILISIWVRHGTDKTDRY